MSTLAAPSALQPTDDAESRRLAAVHALGLLDTPPEPAFDGVVRIASQLFGMPMAYLGVLDADRLWLKASVGLDRTGLADDVAAGVHALQQSLAGASPLTVFEDLMGGGRTADSLLVRRREPIRFLATAGIVDEAGQLLGSVGVMDTEARSFNAGQQALLKDVAGLALTAMQARQRGRLLQQIADNDPLTGAADARQFEQALDVELRHAMRSGEPFAVLRLDLDGLGDINTAYGAVAGDAVLREVARRLHQQVRLGDLLARLGGDDFGIVMRHGGLDEAQALVARIVAAVRQPIVLAGGEELSPGISVGLAAYDDGVASVPALLAQAEASLAAARARKESRWMVFGRLFEGGPELRPLGRTL
ncbi:GGDEF domain-containing protein [Piscinibacter sakaiensis]|uniref:diguanylate cyclase n=1 Tax=Piscinibacter sakaiensis TaxID=1547922 RepID=A0A0K8P649_PISS1|nr:sensor domain-containing diguanylate cyclase [Piscinibacter sakaiensis]GAP37675.1 GGDEF domain protein [Piscinibacter sakaiensis]